MGLFDMIKGAVNAVTGGGAKVTIEFQPALVMPGGAVQVKVTATSTGGEIKSQGCYVDVLGSEVVNAQGVHATRAHAPAAPTAPPAGGGLMGQVQAASQPAPAAATGGDKVNVSVSKTSFEQSFRIAPAMVLAPNETKVFTGTITIPATAQPTFQGAYAKHTWMVRGRIEAWGNDPDSGYQTLRVGLAT